MSTDTINRASLTPALVRYLRRILDEQPLSGDGGLLRVPPGTTGTRVAGQAARLGVVTIREDMVARDIPKIRAALRVHDLGTLPEGVVVEVNGRVTHLTKLLGTLRRTGAARGSKPRWFVDSTGLGIPLISGDFDDRTQAARALCKASGLALPGEE